MSTFNKCTGKRGLDDVYYYDVTNNLWVWKANGGSTYYMSASVGIPKWADGAGTKYYPTGLLYGGVDVYIGPYPYLYFWYGYHPTLGSGTFASSVIGVASGTFYMDMGSGNYKLSGLPANPVAFTWTTATVAGYSSSTLIGVYTEVGGVATKWLGWRKYMYTGVTNPGWFGYFLEQNTIYNTKSIYFDTEDNGTRQLYLLVCWWDSSVSKWVISKTAGTKDSVVGYWLKATGAEPSGRYARVWTGSGPDLSQDLDLASPCTYVAGTQTTAMYMGQTTLWL